MFSRDRESNSSHRRWVQVGILWELSTSTHTVKVVSGYTPPLMQRMISSIWLLNLRHSIVKKCSLALISQVSERRCNWLWLARMNGSLFLMVLRKFTNIQTTRKVGMFWRGTELIGSSTFMKRMTRYQSITLNRPQKLHAISTLYVLAHIEFGKITIQCIPHSVSMPDSHFKRTWEIRWLSISLKPLSLSTRKTLVKDSHFQKSTISFVLTTSTVPWKMLGVLHILMLSCAGRNQVRL